MKNISITIIEPGKAPVKLVLQSGKGYRLGRDADIVLDDPRCSRMHLCLKVEADNKLQFADLDSKNGTYRNGLRAKEGTLNPGDLLMLGRSRVLVALESSYPAVTQGNLIERPEHVR